MPTTVNTNRISSVEYSIDNLSYIRSLDCLTGICAKSLDESENIVEVQVGDTSQATLDRDWNSFSNGFTIFVYIHETELSFVPNGTYGVSVKGFDEMEYTYYGSLVIPPRTFQVTDEVSFKDRDVMVLHRTNVNEFTLCNSRGEHPTLSAINHATNLGYLVKGIGATTNSSKFLRSDGSWETPGGAQYQTLATNAHATNDSYVVKGSGYSGTPTKFLKEDGTWEVPTGTTYAALSASSHASGTGYLVNGIGASTNTNSFLRNDGKWESPTGTTYNTMSSANHADNSNYVIQGIGSVQDASNWFLCGMGVWKEKLQIFPILTSLNHEAGNPYTVKGIGQSTNTTDFLRNDGSWATPTNTTYGTFTTAANGLVPKPTSATASTGYVLSGNGTWVAVSNSPSQAVGLYGASGNNPSKGTSIPTTQNANNFPASLSTQYDGTANIEAVLFPTEDATLAALPVEISDDGVIYVPLSQQFAQMLKEQGYTQGE